jgi:hypothetical protein
MLILILILDAFERAVVSVFSGKGMTTKVRTPPLVGLEAGSMYL